MQEISIVNVVGGGSIHRELDLGELSQDFPTHVEYEPETFAAVVIRYDSPKGTVMLYSSGNYSLAGSKSTSEIRDVNELFQRQMRKILGEDLNRAEFEIRYLVGSGDLGVELDLHQLAIGLGTASTEYEPEQFPALFYNPSNENWFCSIFRTGKIVISGAKNEKSLTQIYDNIGNKINHLLQRD